jgi:hypothetical protein
VVDADAAHARVPVHDLFAAAEELRSAGVEILGDVKGTALAPSRRRAAVDVPRTRWVT